MSATVRRAQPWLGTLVSITAMADDRATAVEAAGRAFAEVRRIHALMSFHSPASDIGRVNRAPVGEAVRVSLDTASVLRAARDLEDASDGAFDCTVAAALVAHGRLRRPPGELPRAPSWTLVGCTVTKETPCWIDLGGIAKGYAVDRATEELLAHGASSGLVNAGGDLRHSGSGEATIHLRDPERPDLLESALTLRNVALASSATSGLEGAKVSSLVDGATREPLPGGGGASVLAPTCLLADALTKVVLARRDPEDPLLARHGAEVVAYRAPGGGV
jgi:thiamine biosynthesis lipoprotein